MDQHVLKGGGEHLVGPIENARDQVTDLPLEKARVDRQLLARVHLAEVANVVLSPSAEPRPLPGGWIWLVSS